MRLSALIAAAALALVPAAVASCGGDDEPQTLSGKDVAKNIKSKLDAEKKTKAERVECPKPLKAEKGAKTECRVISPPLALPVTATVTSVDDGKVNYSIKVGNKPEIVPPDEKTGKGKSGGSATEDEGKTGGATAPKGKTESE